MSKAVDVPVELLCPVCSLLPEKEVYQCQDGHILCSKCFSKKTKCPQCSLPLDKNEPIRNRHFEGLLPDYQKVDCAFKENGYKEKIRKNLIEDHQKGCCFDTERFGEFMKICKMMSYDCKFDINNGNTEEAVKHFIFVHGAVLTKHKNFEMELPSFDRIIKSRKESNQIWSPVITELKEKNCFILMVASHSKKTNTFGWYSVYLPYPNSDESLSVVPIQVKYSLSDKHPKAPVELSLTQEPIFVKNAKNVRGSGFLRKFPTESLEHYINKEGTLVIHCKVKIKDTEERKDKLESFQCLNGNEPNANTEPPRWIRHDGSPAAKELLGQLMKDCIGDEHRVRDDIFVEKLFSKESLAQIWSKEELKYLKEGALFVLAVFGSQIGFGKLFDLYPDLDINTVNGSGATPLLCTMRDRDFQVGFEKVPCLLRLGANIKALDDKKRNLLHWAAWKASDVALTDFTTKDFDLNAVDDDGKTPLHYAMMDEVTGFTLDKAGWLLQIGANPDLKDKNGQCPLDIAFKVKSKFRFKLRQMIQFFKED